MAQYTAEFLAIAQHGYENTDQPMRELARDLGIGITTLSTLVENNHWAKRSQRRRGLPPAMQLFAEAQALVAKGSAHSRASGNPDRAQQQTQEELGPRFRGDERGEIETPTPTLPVAGGGSESTRVAPDPADLLLKLEQILAQLIAAQHLAPANGAHSPQGARTLTLLINSLRALQGMRGPALTDTGSTDNGYDDMPADLDEFRLALARRIEALFESEEDAEDANAHSGCANVDAG
jgi:hypothetical protein